MKKKIFTIVGTRPEIIKMFPVIIELDKYFKNTLILSGQHYNKNLTDKIFKDLNLRKPDQKIKIVKKENFFFEFSVILKKIIEKEKPEMIIYHGDTLTTLSSALVCNLHFPNIKSVHVESGYRSNDRNSMEENIRKIVDFISNVNFTSRNEETINLKKEGILKNVYTVGNTINDTVKILKNKLIKIKNKRKYIYTTIHRAENVDNKFRLKNIFKFLNFISKKIDIILSIHPRTKKMLKKFNLKISENIKIIEPPVYSKNLSYLYNSHFCISDSGGLQEEAVLLRKNVLYLQTKHLIIII